MFEINSVAFKVQASTIQGAGLGLFVHTSITRGITILHYGGDKYYFDDWRKVCKENSRARKYTLVEDPKVDIEDSVYIVGDVKDGNVAGYINSCHGMNIDPNVCYTFVPELPPWRITNTKVKSAEYGFICVETLRDIQVGEELFAIYEFDYDYVNFQ